MDISTYRLTIMAGVVVLILSVGLVLIVAPNQASQYITLVGTVAVPGLFALFRLERNAQQNTERHAENQQAIGALINEQRQLVTDNVAVKQALLSIKDSSMTVEEAAHAAAQAIQPATDPSLGGTH